MPTKLPQKTKRLSIIALLSMIGIVVVFDLFAIPMFGTRANNTFTTVRSSAGQTVRESSKPSSEN
jgi:hypothetical protein